MPPIYYNHPLLAVVYFFIPSIFPILINIAIPGLTFGQSPIGLWQTKDDQTNEVKSYVEIFQKDYILYGKINKLLTAPPNKICDLCPGNRKNKPLVGMVILENLISYKNYWRKGTILDPESGKTYSATLWFENDPDILFVRGKHWTGLYRTQQWSRIKTNK